MQFTYLAAVPLLVSSALAQTFTACNPLLRDGCPNNPALSTNTTFNLTNSHMLDNKLWNTTAGKINWNDLGADFTIGGRGDSPTIASKFYIFGGVFSVVMRAASGKGIVSSMILQSEALDEVDWEFIGGDNANVQSNYFGKGNSTTYDRMKMHPVEDPQGKFHNYTVNWTKERIDFYIDDNKVRTLTYGEAEGGKFYPQTPMNLRLGIWAGGDPENNSPGTVEWAGGETNFRDGPFTMTIASIYAQDFSTGKEYAFTDRSGDWDSIDIVPGEAYAIQRINEPKGISGRWNAMPQGARIGIVAGAITAFTVAVLAILFFCIKQRRLGRREHAKLLEESDKDQMERLYWKDKVDHSPNAPLGRQ